MSLSFAFPASLAGGRPVPPPRPLWAVSAVCPVRLPGGVGGFRLACPAGSVAGSPVALFVGAAARCRCWRFSVACPVRGSVFLWLVWSGPGRVPSRAAAAVVLARRSRLRVLA